MKSKKVFLMFFLVLCLCTLVFNGEMSRVSKLAYTIINVDDNGYFNYHGKVSKLVRRGQEVIWVCNAPFTVYFGEISPLVLNPSGKPTWGKMTRGIQSKLFDSSLIDRLKSRLEQLKKVKEGLTKKSGKIGKMELDSSIKGLELLLKRAESNRYYVVQAWISKNTLSGKYKYIIAAYVNGKIWVDDPEDIVDPPRR